MAAGTLLLLDASLPGGLIEGSGSIPYAQTMAFTTLILFQLFNVFNARSDEQSAFRGLLRNHWLWAAIGFSLALQFAVIYVPFLQKAFSTVSLTLNDWLLCTVVASSVLWLRELSKIITRRKDNRRIVLTPTSTGVGSCFVQQLRPKESTNHCPGDGSRRSRNKLGPVVAEALGARSQQRTDHADPDRPIGRETAVTLSREQELTHSEKQGERNITGHSLPD